MTQKTKAHIWNAPYISGFCLNVIPISDKHLQKQHRYAADDRDFEKTQFLVGGNNAYYKRNQTGQRAVCRINDCRESHYRQGDVWNIVKKVPDELVFDRLSDQCQRKYSDQGYR